MAVASPPHAPATAATIVALVAHARSVASLQREAFARTLARLPDDPSRIVLRTCHRVELYAAADGAVLPDLAELPPGVERLTDVEAVRHLFAVACGLDSAVFGETQILHQLRETLEMRHTDQALEPVLDRLFQSALRAGREARGFFTGSPRSLADAALDRIAAGSGLDATAALPGPVLVVGVGRMARLAAFAATRRGIPVIVTNRTAARAVELAAEVDGRVVPFGTDGVLDPLSGVIVAIAGPWPLGHRDLETIAGCGATVVDLSSPPALGENAISRLGRRAILVDDLASDAGDGPDDRTRNRVERLMSKAGIEYCQWLRSRDSVPAIRAVVGSAEQRRAAEMTWLRRRLPDLAPDDLVLVEQMSHRLVAALLHAPLTALTADQDGALEPAARELFGI